MRAGRQVRDGGSLRARRVLEVMELTGGPVTAYELLAALSADGMRSPAAIYRALRTLEREGSVIRIETLNAWMTGSGRDRRIVTICEDCGGVGILPGEEAAERLCGIARAAGFVATNAAIELRGRCGSCRDSAQ